MKKLVLFAIVSVMMIGCAKDEAPEPQVVGTTNEEIQTKTNPAGWIIDYFGDGIGVVNPQYFPNQQYGFQLMDFQTNMIGSIVWRVYDLHGNLIGSQYILGTGFDRFNSRVIIKFPKAGTFSITATYSIPGGGGYARVLEAEKSVWVLTTLPWDPSYPGTEIIP